MTKITTYLDILEAKVKALLEEKKRLLSEIEKIEKINIELKETIEITNIKIEEKQNENIALKLSTNIEEFNKTEVKTRINEMVREIDKCIAYLNK